jgi:hypothetical protein
LRGQALAALFAGTLPMACLQAVTTQNDLVCAFWLTCFIWAALRIWRRPAVCWSSVLLCGLSLGLALLTKATAYIFAAPFALGLAGVVVWKRGLSGFGPIALLALPALLINLPMYVRDYRFNQRLLGDAQNDLVYANSPISFGHAASNVIRNIALELALGPRPLRAKVEEAARGLHRAWGLDADDLSSTFPLTRFDLSAVRWNDEDAAPNPFHLVLAVSAAVALGWRGHRAVQFYWLGIGLAFLGFCAYLRWQPWHARLHLALFILASPCVGVAMRNWNRRIVAALATGLCLGAIPYLAFNAHHPLLGPSSIWNTDRDRLRFIARPGLEAAFRQAADLATKSRCRQVGLIFTGDDWEYALEAMLAERDPTIRVETFAGPWLATPATENRGWDDHLRPYVIEKFISGVPTGVDLTSRP